MKKNRYTGMILRVLIMMLCVMMVSSACAGTSTESGSYSTGGSSYWTQQLNALPPFKFEIHNYGIGYGNCPVYTAPSEDSYRCAGGKASCQTNSKMDDAGYVSGWLLVRYETNNGNVRVGYIPPKYVRGYKSKMAPHFGFIPATADETIYVTDNPMSHVGSFAMLAPGESFYILSKYNYYQKNGLEWWYIQCTVDGQTACGFIEMNTRFHLGN